MLDISEHVKMNSLMRDDLVDGWLDGGRVAHGGGIMEKKNS